MFRYLIVWSILCFHCVTRWIASLNRYVCSFFILERKRLIKNIHFPFINVPFLTKDKMCLNYVSFCLTTSVI